MRNTESLTKTEQHQLKQSGYSSSDMTEIIRGIKRTDYSLVTPDGRQLTISEGEAVERLGREEWVKAVAKSAFSMIITVRGLGGESIRLHTKNYA